MFGYRHRDDAMPACCGWLVAREGCHQCRGARLSKLGGTMKSSVVAAFVVVLANVVGCAVPVSNGESDDEPVGTAMQANKDIPPSGQNGKHGHCTWHIGSRQAYKTLGNQALNHGGGELPSVAILPECRDEVIANAVECALLPNQSVRDPITGHVFHGWWGLAPSWYSTALNASGRSYVTACMVQRLNAFGATVPILLEGAWGTIQANTSFQAEFPFEESIAYGDLFTPPVTSTAVNVCYNDDLDSACHAVGTTAEDWLRLRICDSTPSCGLTVIGKCSQVCIANASGGYPMCKRADGTYDDKTVEVRLELAHACGQ
ncbi:Hypothetical protein A7982_10515 [Minicystis rosea]|nr:Hypothetical protein A7982_10515 [Minicystis rosea]